jgi:Holliday junction resolvase RusA-like endonuclease
VIRFFVAGTPKSMSVGSTFSFKRNGVQTHVQGRRNTDWAVLVAEIGRRHAPPRPLEGPLTFEAIFYVPRPASLPKRTAHLAMPVKRPDCDGLVHKLTDRFNGVFWTDDSQIVDFIARKRYATAEHPPGVHIRIAHALPIAPVPSQGELVSAP